MHPLSQYLQDVQQIHHSGASVKETSYYPALATLFNSVVKPLYAISNPERFSPQTLYAIAGAFTRRPVWVSLCGGLRRAVRREWKWWREIGSE